jgi:hypothetical protein
MPVSYRTRLGQNVIEISQNVINIGPKAIKIDRKAIKIDEKMTSGNGTSENRRVVGVVNFYHTYKSIIDST